MLVAHDGNKSAAEKFARNKLSRQWVLLIEIIFVASLEGGRDWLVAEAVDVKT